MKLSESEMKARGDMFPGAEHVADYTSPDKREKPQNFFYMVCSAIGGQTTGMKGIYDDFDMATGAWMVLRNEMLAVHWDALKTAREIDVDGKVKTELLMFFDMTTKIFSKMLPVVILLSELGSATDGSLHRVPLIIKIPANVDLDEIAKGDDETADDNQEDEE